MLVEGHAGIGKTALLDAAVAEGHEMGWTVLRAPCSELESGFAFGVALQLFGALLASADDETHDRLLTGPAAFAGPLLGRPVSWEGDEGDDRAYTVIHGLFWLLSNLADAGPALIAIDDAHWADRASLRFALYLLQRVSAMRVAIVVGRRLGEPGAPDALLGQIAAHTSSEILRPRPLSPEGARRFVHASLPEADGVFTQACWQMTEGNCFLLGELVRAVESEGWQATAHTAARLGTLAPDAVLRTVAVRLMRQPDDAAAVARAVAVLGDDAQLRRVAALMNLEAGSVAAAADALAAGEILRPASPGALRFAHPLLASAVYADIGSGERAALHSRAAEILRDEGVAAPRVAAHLLPSAGSGEQWVVDELSAAARQAMETGQLQSAASYLRRGLQEPPSARSLPVLLRLLGLCETATDLPSAIVRLEDALTASVDDRDRAQTLLALGRARSCDGHHAAALVAFREVAACAGAGGQVVVQAAAESVALGLLDPSSRVPILQGAPQRTRAGAAESSLEQRMVAATDCLREAMVGESKDTVLALARRALHGGPLPTDPGGGGVLVGVSLALQSCDELAWNDRVLSAAIAQARARGSMMAFATASLQRAVSRWGQGRVDEAMTDAEQAVFAERYGWRHLLPAAYATLVGLHAERGEYDAATAWAGRLDLSQHAGSALLAPWHTALGRVALGERRWSDALQHFEDWRKAATGVRNPAMFAGWRSGKARALAVLGRTDEASELAVEELALARRFAAPRAISSALRELAHARAQGTFDQAITLLEEAVAVAGGSEARLEHCRALLELGIVLRRAGRRTDAGRSLGEALELARTCGALRLQDRAREEIDVAGTRVQRAARRGADALSPSERRVVALAIEGLSNRQIAEALFVTRKAVEWHLGNAFRKLDVRSRGELAGALGAPGRR